MIAHCKYAVCSVLNKNSDAYYTRMYAEKMHLKIFNVN